LQTLVSDPPTGVEILCFCFKKLIMGERQKKRKEFEVRETEKES